MPENLAERKAHERDYARVKGRIAHLIRAVEDGLYAPSMMDTMRALEAGKLALEALLADSPDTPELRLHPGLASR